MIGSIDRRSPAFKSLNYKSYYGIPLNPGRPIVVGLAGGIASGKSTCARLLAGTRGAVIDADQIVKNLQNEPDVISKMEQILGAPLRNADGQLDRAAAANITFSNPEKLKALEEWIHPLARLRIEALLEDYLKKGAETGDPEIVVMDVPLLFEGGLYKRCDRVLFIEASADARTKRSAQTRGWNEAELPRREARQWSLDEKRRLSNGILQNSGSPAELAQAAKTAREELLQYWNNH